MSIRIPLVFPARRAICALGILLSFGALASQAGFKTLSVPAGSDGPSIPVALYYPTQAPERAITMGLFTAHVAMRAEPEARVKGLILLSHGQGGSELGHGSIAEALARDGYLVAALRQPGDNWQDTSLIRQGAAAYLTQRPQQASRAIDAVLADPEWKARIDSDAGGPKVGAVGHSAGGYTVLALAGGVPDPARILSHCASHRAEDPVLCRNVPMVPATGNAPSADEKTAVPKTPRPPMPPLAAPRVRAVAALAPLGVPFTPRSLAAIRIPVLVEAGELDTFLVPRFHARWVAQNLPGIEFHMVPEASHWAFMDTPGMSISTPDGDVRDDPPGFDRQKFLQGLGRQLAAFFDAALHEAPRPPSS